ncbi:protein sel-1 homolog 1-like [Paramacrobiotus metropolitanus]|uniref:protein sel-1 homolog 1-like n=1 Tax=Paramacrobiotus metropolitanus TaxID=2943436 RepID=UPI0024461E89|nr:protein sel-1 homolog 1-like [Paramacrobiotus metropolitanus]
MIIPSRCVILAYISVISFFAYNDGAATNERSADIKEVSGLDQLFQEDRQIAITVLNADYQGVISEIGLLPLAGSYEHITSRNAREEEERKYFEVDSEADDESTTAGDTAFAAAMSYKLRTKLDVNGKYQMWKSFENAAWLGHVEAQEYVAMEYLLGNGLALNISGAWEFFENLKEKAHPLGQMGAAFLHSTGIGGDTPSQALALLHYMFAALGGNTFAQMALGYRYLYGSNVESKCEQALHFYRKAASKVVDHVPITGGPSIQKIRLYEEWENPGVNNNMDDDLMQYYTFIANKGDTSAQVILGQLYLQGGRGVPQDRLMALRYFEKAYEGESVNAGAFLGRMYLEGSAEVPQDNATALHYFRQAAERGNAMGQSGLGLVYLYGRGVDVDYKLAAHYFKLSADQSYVDGQAMMAVMYFHGLGVERDLGKAIKLFNQASQSGSIMSVFYLAEINAFGFGVARMCKTAVELYKSVAERGRWSTMFMDAFNDYKKGDLNRALVKYMFLADMGYEVAQSNTAFLLDKNEPLALGFPQNESFGRAIIYWERAAAQGYNMARIKLGDYHYYGLGTEVDYEEAMANYRQIEQSNNAQALFNLGYMYQAGLGVKQDLHLAKRYYDRAAETSVDAHAPVTLALMSLGALFVWNQIFSSVYNFSMPDSISGAILHSAVEYWDLYLAAGLACILISVLIIMQRVTQELARQRNERRRATVDTHRQNVQRAQQQSANAHGDARPSSSSSSETHSSQASSSSSSTGSADSSGVRQRNVAGNQNMENPD